MHISHFVLLPNAYLRRALRFAPQASEYRANAWLPSRGALPTGAASQVRLATAPALALATRLFVEATVSARIRPRDSHRRRGHRRLNCARTQVTRAASSLRLAARGQLVLVMGRGLKCVPRGCASDTGMPVGSASSRIVTTVTHQHEKLAASVRKARSRAG
eukprot:6174731-Pleurochrysis_carterae.AAC.1